HVGRSLSPRSFPTRRSSDLGPGQALCIPRGAVHRFDNHGSEDVKALCVITPAAIGPQFFRESAAVINEAGGGPPDRAKMIDVMRDRKSTRLNSSHVKISYAV